MPRFTRNGAKAPEIVFFGAARAPCPSVGAVRTAIAFNGAFPFTGAMQSSIPTHDTRRAALLLMTRI